MTERNNKVAKDQFVVAYVTSFEKDEVMIAHTLRLSSMLKKGVILLYICDPQYNDTEVDEAERKLKQMQQSIEEESGCEDISYAVLRGNTREVIHALPVVLNAIAVVVKVDRKAKKKHPQSRRSVLRNFSTCRIAFMTVQSNSANKTDYNDVALAIDFKKESKDKIVWAGHFARFNKSRLHVLYYDYKDEFLRQKWYNNMQFLHKMLTNLNLTFEPHIMGNKSTFTDVNAMEYAQKEGYGMMIGTTTKERDAIEWFIGVQERRTIVNPTGIPVLFLNPREDLYIICD